MMLQIVPAVISTIIITIVHVLRHRVLVIYTVCSSTTLRPLVRCCYTRNCSSRLRIPDWVSKTSFGPNDGQYIYR